MYYFPGIGRADFYAMSLAEFKALNRFVDELRKGHAPIRTPAPGKTKSGRWKTK